MNNNVDPFHEGERRVQQRAGQVRDAEQNSAMIGSRIPGGAVPFLREQSLLVMALFLDDELWCLPMLGTPGWLSVPVPGELRLDLSTALIPVDSRILYAAETAQQVGVLVLDSMTRRRLRVNGRLSKRADGSFVVSVSEAYPNCPKYITRRNVRWTGVQASTRYAEGTVLREEQRDAFRNTDVFFIASQHPDRGLDASHRGGNPGFVVSPSPDTLRFADFPGNSLFNTLGNLEVDHHVGMLLPDFRGGRMIELTGTATVLYGDDLQDRTVEVKIKRWKETCLSGVETEVELSPFNP